MRLSIILIVTVAILTVGSCGDDNGRPQTETDCGNGIDDDFDMRIDCDDTDCMATPACLALCNNNGICDAGEEHDSCPADCPCNMDYFCDIGAGENHQTCPSDCYGVCIVDGYCDVIGGEDQWSCSQDCGPVCGNGVCESGETAQTCPQDCGPLCGDGVCEGGETALTCPQDCGPTCGDGVCEGGETEQSCPADCTVCDTPEDLLNQTGCPTGEVCSLLANVIQCGAPGTNAYYVDCSDNQGCVGGSACITDNSSAYCLPFCETGGAQCPSGGFCMYDVPTNAGTVQVCALPDNCDPITSSGCGVGESCVIITMAVDVKCFTAGTGSQGSSCQYLNDCVAGHSCWGNPGVCEQVCSLSSPVCAVGTCTDVGFTALDVGLCE